jgi:hypothetical protein
MSAFLQSGRSCTPNTTGIKVRFRPKADINIVERREIQDQTEVFQFISVRPRFSYGLQGILGKRQPAANYVFRMAVSNSPLWQFISTMAFLLLDRPSLKTMLIRH